MAFATDATRIYVGRICAINAVAVTKLFNNDPFLFSMALRAVGNLTRCDENIMRVVGLGVMRGISEGVCVCVLRCTAMCACVRAAVLCCAVCMLVRVHACLCLVGCTLTVIPLYSLVSQACAPTSHLSMC